ncbi:hypothetical protein LJB68_04685 [bacterium 210820-DFI.6.52]|nr:hypothetical protein [bacterium 210820-DFI.6.52]
MSKKKLEIHEETSQEEQKLANHMALGMCFGVMGGSIEHSNEYIIHVWSNCLGRLMCGDWAIGRDVNRNGNPQKEVTVKFQFVE